MMSVVGKWFMSAPGWGYTFYPQKIRVTGELSNASKVQGSTDLTHRTGASCAAEGGVWKAISLARAGSLLLLKLKRNAACRKSLLVIYIRIHNFIPSTRYLVFVYTQQYVSGHYLVVRRLLQARKPPAAPPREGSLWAAGGGKNVIYARICA